MSSTATTQSNSWETAFWGIGLLLLGLVVKYGSTIARAEVVVQNTTQTFFAKAWPIAKYVLPALLLLLLGYVVWDRFLRKLPEMTTDVDLSMFNPKTMDWDDPKPDNGNPAPAPEPAVQPTPAPQEPLHKLVIDVDGLLSVPLHHDHNLIPEERDILQKSRYLLKLFVPPGKVQPEPFYIKPCPPESLEHTFLVHAIAKELRTWTKEVRTYVTQFPDIIFLLRGKDWALEIETPRELNKARKHARLKAKARTNNERYGSRWAFVVTRSAYAKSLERYGQVFTRTSVLPWLRKLFHRKRP